MQYALMDFGAFQAYQESNGGQVTRYTDLDGNTLFASPPVGNGGTILDANAMPVWALPTPQPEPAPEYVPPVTKLTKLEYLRRFTQDERIAIRQAASASPVLDDYLRLLELAEDVTLTDPDTMAAVAMLEAVGLLVAGRAEEILRA